MIKYLPCLLAKTMPDYFITAALQSWFDSAVELLDRMVYDLIRRWPDLFPYRQDVWAEAAAILSRRLNRYQKTGTEPVDNPFLSAKWATSHAAREIASHLVGVAKLPRWGSRENVTAFYSPESTVELLEAKEEEPSTDKEWLREALKPLGKLRQTIAEWHYIYGLSQTEIANVLGYTRAAISLWMKEINGYLSTYLDRL